MATAAEFGVIQNFFGVGSTPLIYEDLLITMIGGSPEESQSVPRGQLDRVQPDASGIVAFDRLTGEVRYRTINDLASRRVINTTIWLRNQPPRL